MLVSVAWLAAALVFATFFMKTIVPLRMLAIASNVAFITYGALGVANGIGAQLLPILVLHVALLPVNVLRLHEVRSAIRAVRSLESIPPAADFLIPFMQARDCPAGTVLFRQGDPADLVYVIEHGQVRLAELDKVLGPGALFGEIAVFNANACRTATAVCEQDCRLHAITGARILELFYQDREFAFQIARSLSRYA